MNKKITAKIAAVFRLLFINPPPGCRRYVDAARLFVVVVIFPQKRAILKHHLLNCSHFYDVL
ncbi:MAG: hypothetical protein WAK95_22820, partial [Desulfobacterales bacterium]